MFDTQVFGRGSKIDLRGGLDTYGVVEEVKLIEVHEQDLVLGVKAFELGGNDPFDGLLHGTLKDVIGSWRP